MYRADWNVSLQDYLDPCEWMCYKTSAVLIEMFSSKILWIHVTLITLVNQGPLLQT